MRLATTALIALILVGCGGGGSGGGGKPAPKDVAVTSQGGQMFVTWAAVEGATEYNIYYASEPGIDPDHHAVLSDSLWTRSNDTSATLTPLNMYKQYFIVVTAVFEDIESKASEEVTTVPRFEVLPESPSTVLDYAAEVEWQRCVRGAEWNVSTNACEGDAIVDNIDGHTAGAEEVPGDGWHIPGLLDAASIVYCPDGRPDYIQQYQAAGFGSICTDPPLGYGEIALLPPFFDRAESVPYLTRSRVSGGTNRYTVNYRNSGVSQAQYTPDAETVVHYARPLPQ